LQKVKIEYNKAIIVSEHPEWNALD
jgi:hypothetical protein